MTHSPNNDLRVNQFANALKQRGLHSVALTLLEAGQPLAFLGGQFLLLAQPAINLLWPQAEVRQLAQLLEDPAAVHHLMTTLAADEAAV